MSTEELSEQIKAAQKRHNEALEVEKSTGNALRELQLRYTEVAFGIRIGSIVKDRKGCLFRVTRYAGSFPGDEKRSWGKPWVSGNPQKKDKSYGTAERNLYGQWEVMEG